MEREHNSFIELIHAAERRNRCVKRGGYCTTCGMQDVHDALSHIDLDQALRSLDLHELWSIPGWDKFLQAAARHPEFDRLPLLESWLPMAGRRIRFADIVLFYFVRPTTPLFQPWVDTCSELALRNGDESLMESLLYTIRERFRGYPELFELALSMAPQSMPIRSALWKAGLIPSDTELKMERATRNLPDAVRRNDPRAVRALLSKGADPNWVDPETGVTGVDLAKSSANRSLLDLIMQNAR